MIHETPSPETCLTELKKLMKPEGQLLIVEPLFHVSKSNFKTLQRLAAGFGFRILHEKTNVNGRTLLLTI